MSARRFCAFTVLLALFGWSAIASLNFIVNPYAQYPTRLVEPLVQLSRSQKVNLLQQMKSAPAGLILGSSRVLKLEPDYLEAETGLPFFNGGVNHGRPEDFLALLRFYRSEFDHYPSILVLGLDVSAFAPSNIDARLLSQPELVKLIPEVIRIRDRFQLWRELLSWQQTKSSLKALQYGWLNSRPPEVESYRPDGLLVYRQREAELAAGIYDFDAALEYNKREYRHLFADYPELSAERLAYFETLVETCRTNDVQLIVFATPLHPELTSHLRDETDYAERREELVRYLTGAADRSAVEFYDFTDITTFHGDPGSFVDGIHPLESNTRRMIDRMQEPSPRPTYVVQ